MDYDGIRISPTISETVDDFVKIFAVQMMGVVTKDDLLLNLFVYY